MVKVTKLKPKKKISVAEARKLPQLTELKRGRGRGRGRGQLGPLARQKLSQPRIKQPTQFKAENLLENVPQTQKPQNINPQFQGLRESFDVPKSPRFAEFGSPKLTPETTRLEESFRQPSDEISIFGRPRPVLDTLEERRAKKDIICRTKIVKGKKKTICKPRKPKKKKGKRSQVEKEFDFFKGIL